MAPGRLEISSEKARLFAVMDADANSRLAHRELWHGILRVRGEAQRSNGLAAAPRESYWKS